MSDKEKLIAEWRSEIEQGRWNENFWKNLTPARLQEFIDADAEINAPDSWGFSPIHRIAENNENPAVIKKLTGAGADIHSKAYGSPPLLYAAQSNREPAIIKALVEAGAKIHEATEKCGKNQSFVGNTALHWAASSNKNVAVIKELIDAGANIYEKNAGGYTAHDLLLSRNSALKDNTEAQELLRGKTTNKTSRDDNDEYATSIRNDEYEMPPRNGLEDDKEYAKKVIEDWLTKPTPQIARLWGHAGTGKTTFLRSLDFGNIKPSYCAFTGKAASVMRKKGMKKASTIHKLIYMPYYGNLNKPKLRHFTSKLNLIIVDECSMVSEKMGLDLLSVTKKILVLGDKYQLPPMEGKGFFNGDECNAIDLELKKIHRQKEDSPIIKFATLARNGQEIPLSNNTICTVEDTSMPNTTESLHEKGDIIICARNDTRHKINEEALTRQGLTKDWLMEGMQIVCLKNNYRLELFNGTIWIVKEIREIKEHTDGKKQKSYLTAECVLMDDEGNRKEAHVINSSFGEDNYDESHINKNTHAAFDYGYAITCHKAQGSQWERVSIYVEMPRSYDDYNQWLYTAATRAQKSLYVLFAND